MKKFDFRNLIIMLVFAALQILVSCGTYRKTALDCPSIPDARFNNNARHETVKKSNNTLYAFNRTGHRKMVNNKSAVLAHNSETNKTMAVRSGEVKIIKRNDDHIFGIDIDKNEFINGLTASADNNQLILNTHEINSSSLTRKGRTAKVRFSPSEIQEVCDTIVSVMGDVIIGKVTEVSDTEIKYKRCGISNGPTFTIRRSNISLIKYANGTRDFFTAPVPVDIRYSNHESPIEGLGLAGFILGLGGLFVLGIPFGLLALIFGAISLSRINREPGRYRGRGFAIASIVLGIVDIISILLYVLLLI
jgi:hypothetical protein